MPTTQPRPDAAHPTPIRIALIDDHRAVAEAMADRLGREADLDVVAVCVDARCAADTVARHAPAVVLVDYVMPFLDGASIAAEIRALQPEARVIMLTSESTDEALRAALAAGCAGFLGKDAGIDEIVSTVRSVAAGGSSFPSGAVARLLPTVDEDAEHGSDAADTLTERERTVLELLAEGWGTREIAAHLELSINTVRNYVQAVIGKLHAHSKLEAVATALRQGLVQVHHGGRRTDR
ncbi:MAG: response regulator [Jatrophihabitans sp.]|uniref:response regulator n=1 Tax=Jatrophihabitans sp. TaxID=1932789 RepID=UPI003F80C995